MFIPENQKRAHTKTSIPNRTPLNCPLSGNGWTGVVHSCSGALLGNKKQPLVHAATWMSPRCRVNEARCEKLRAMWLYLPGVLEKGKTIGVEKPMVVGGWRWGKGLG